MRTAWLRVRHRMFATITAAVVVALGGTWAWAQPGTSPHAETHSDPRIDLARQHYLQGNAYYRLDKFREALSEYEQAYIAKTDPSFLYNIAQCQRLMGNRVEALKYYKRFLVDQSNSPNAPVARMHIHDIEASLGKPPGPAAPVVGPTTPPPPPRVAPPASAPSSAPVTASVPPSVPPSLPPSGSPSPRGTDLALNSAPPPAEAEASMVSVVSNAGGAPSDRGDGAIYTRPWFWGVVGAVVVAGVVAAVVLSSGDQCDGGRVCK